MEILIVENSPEFRADIQEMLTYASRGVYRLHEACTGHEGIGLIHQLNESPSRCLLLGCALPDMCAEGFITRLKGDAEQTPLPVVVMTSDKSTDGLSFIRLGAQDYVSKSGLTASTLIRVLQNAVERFEMIRENKKVMRQLSESEARLKVLFDESEKRRLELEAMMEAVPAQVWISRDRDCRNIVGNKAVSEFVNTSRGSNLSMTAPMEERPTNFQTFRNGKQVPMDELPMQRAARTGTPVRGIELELRFSDGNSKWIYGNAEPLKDARGEVYGAIAGMIDFTEQKHSYTQLARHEELMRSIFNTTRTLLILLSKDGIVIAANPLALSTIGRQLVDVAAKPLWNTGWMRNMSGSQSGVEQALAKALKGEISQLDGLSETCLKQNQKLVFEFVPVRDVEGNVSGVLVEGRQSTGARSMNQETTNHNRNASTVEATLWKIKNESPECGR